MIRLAKAPPEYTEEKLQSDHVTRLFIQRLDSFLNRDLIRNAFCRIVIWQIPIVVSLTWPFYFSAFFCGTPLLNVPLQFIQWLQRKPPHSECDKWNLFKNCGCLSSGLKFERCECPVRRWIKYRWICREKGCLVHKKDTKTEHAEGHFRLKPVLLCMSWHKIRPGIRFTQSTHISIAGKDAIYICL